MIATSLNDVKALLSQNLSIDGIDLSSVDETTPLFSGLGLDSLDAIELVIILRKNYDIAVDNMEEGKEIFRTVGTLRAHIEQNRKK